MSKENRKLVIGSLTAEHVAFGDNAQAGTGPDGTYGEPVDGAAVEYTSGPDGWEVQVSHPDGRVEQHSSRTADDADCWEA